MGLPMEIALEDKEAGVDRRRDEESGIKGDGIRLSEVNGRAPLGREGG